MADAIGGVTNVSGEAALRTRARHLLPYAAMLVPLGLYMWYVATYGVNVPYADDLTQIPLVGAAADGHLTLAALWMAHNGNRMLIPNLLGVILYLPTHYDIRAALWFSVILEVGALLILISALRRTSSITGWWLLPIAFIFLDLSQWENMLWGFQVAWYVILISFLGVLYTLSATAKSQTAFLWAIVLGIVASYSSLQGLFVWPCGLILLWGAYNRLTRLLIWSAMGVVVTTSYFAKMPGLVGAGELSFVERHPAEAVRYFITIAGGPGASHAFALGIVVLVGCVAFAFGYWRFSQCRDDLRVPLALIAYPLFFDVFTTIGRATLGVAQAESSRYTTYNLLLIIGLYAGTVVIFHNLSATRRDGRLTFARHAHTAAVVLAVLGISLLLAGTFNGHLYEGRADRATRRDAQHFLNAYQTTPHALLAEYLYPPGAQYVIYTADILLSHHWSVFSKSRI